MSEIIIYADGACRGNPGPAGAGVILMYNEHLKLISHGLGHSTNNIAELTAVLVALEHIKDNSKKIILYTDSQYVIGQLSKNWATNKNKELVEFLKGKIEDYNIEFRWVKGHSGDTWNEEADRLAVKGINLEPGKSIVERGMKK